MFIELVEFNGKHLPGLLFSYGKFLSPELNGNAPDYFVDIYLYGILAEDDSVLSQPNEME